MEQSKWNVPIRLTRVDRPCLWLGIGMVILSFLMPMVFTVENFNIFRTLYQALRMNEKTMLMAAALKLVCLNGLRALPHYIGSFFIAQSLEFQYQEKPLRVINTVLVILILLLTYCGIDAIHQIHYDFGLPAFLVMGMLIFFDKLNYQYISIPKKVTLLASVLLSFQFLDVMPAAESFLTGRGEISMDIKLSSQIMGADTELNILSMVGCALFLLFSVITFLLLRDENNLHQLAALREQNQTIRTKAMLTEVENRTYREMQHLVHDLKSPMTVIQTLTGVFKMECEAEERQEDLELLSRVEDAVDQMSQMISEILYEDKTSLTTVEKLIHRVSAQLSIEEYSRYITQEVEHPEAEVRVNCVLFPRALVNLVHNSASAIPKERTPHIVLYSDCVDRWVRFRVIDNGTGIPPKMQSRIWERGYSGRNSSGLGLSFVRSVVERVGGRIDLCSTEGAGTTITLWIPREGANYEPESE